MARPEDKRRKKRKEAEATQRAYRVRAELQKPGHYPEICFETSEGDGYFVAMVRKAVEGLDFDAPEMGPEWMRGFYRLFHAQGFRAAALALEQLESETHQQFLQSGSLPDNMDDCPRLDDVATHLGECIFERIPIEKRRPFLPMNDFVVDFENRQIVLRFSSLLQEHTSWGTSFYSRLMPKIDLDGKRVTVAYSDHAIRQLCARRTPRYLNYGANGDAHAYLAKCVYHEVVTLSNGSPALKLWDICDCDGFRVYRDYVQTVFGESNRVPYGGRLHYVLGYCPVVLENGFAKAKSFLYPGFRGTPERLVLENSLAATSEYVRSLEEAEDKESQPFFETPRAIEVTKWIHRHGLPQVVQMKQVVLKT